MKDLMELIAVILEVPEKKVKEDSHFIKDLRADSLDTLKLVVAIEESYKIPITDHEVERIHTPKELYAHIQKKKEK
ncbi:acyl carrier protein [Vibrio crassostreae]|uniref:acyl carrier protein n=1 Tax=Vibrio crassostreae TaxID=246167 RepID=UPI001B310701|nr:phosphopantetheine-binding protein [Vibrio crassostreae]